LKIINYILSDKDNKKGTLAGIIQGGCIIITVNILKKCLTKYLKLRNLNFITDRLKYFADRLKPIAMKKLFVIFFLFMAVCTAKGQSLQKGNLVGMHVITFDLKPGYTVDQAIDFYINKYKPAAEANFPGMKAYIVKGIRGENENKIGQIEIFESEAVRDRYYRKDGSLTVAGNEALEKIQPVMDEFVPMGTFTTVYTDWLVQ
jgi:hypothetical protein